MVTSSNFEKLGGDLHVVQTVLDDLDASLPRIIPCPCITAQFVTLITGVASSYMVCLANQRVIHSDRPGFTDD